MLAAALAVCGTSLGVVEHGAKAYSYKPGADVPIYVNKVSPYFNVHETYHYYSIPVCHPDPIVSLPLKLGQVLRGDRMAESLFRIKYKEPIEKETLCTKTLDADDIESFYNAIEELYFWEIFHKKNSHHRHRHAQRLAEIYQCEGFSDSLNSRYCHTSTKIVKATVDEKSEEVELPVDEVGDAKSIEVEFTYSVKWVENKQIPFSKRHLQDHAFFPKTLEIHWLSIINSAVLVALLVGFVAIILNRMLNKDFARYAKESDELDDELEEDQGWKNLHTDVFRFPPYKTLLCAILGNGAQFLLLAAGLLLMAFAGFFHVHHHGSFSSAVVLLYALTCFISGYVSNRFYKAIEGDNWVWNVVLTACIFSIPFFISWSVVNSVAWYLSSTQALPATTIILILLIWLIVGFPLTVLGGILGRKAAGAFDAPTRTKSIHREIPEVPLYKGWLAQSLVAGFLPFSSISVELYYVYASVFGREHYSQIGILALCFVILVVVVAATSVALTYFHLSAENHQWWWRSALNGFSTGFFVFFYSVFYFYVRSDLDGTLQTAQFFVTCGMGSLALGLMTATVSFFASLTFVRQIYAVVKLD